MIIHMMVMIAANSRACKGGKEGNGVDALVVIVKLSGYWKCIVGSKF